MNTWAAFVRIAIGTTTQHAAANRLGVHPTTISGWLHERYTPTAGMAIAFARAFDLNPSEALVAAGHLTPQEAALREATLMNPADIPGDVLVAEMGRRVAVGSS